jgi:ornithine cyclodeaminase/alanine dehydrogenase-like protein (mu-crystallin family)
MTAGKWHPLQIYLRACALAIRSNLADHKQPTTDEAIHLWPVIMSATRELHRLAAVVITAMPADDPEVLQEYIQTVVHLGRASGDDPPSITSITDLLHDEEGQQSP